MRYAVAYLRVSTEDQTVENQRLVLSAWALANQYQIIEYFEDSAVSGTVPAGEREGFRAMMSFLRSEKVDAVLVYELSRVGRTFWDTLATIKEVEMYAPLVPCSPKESFLQTTDPSVRKLLVSIISWVAERERDVLITRIKAGMARAKAAGQVVGRSPKPVDLDKVVELLESGMNKDQVAAKLGICKVTLYRRMRQLS